MFFNALPLFHEKFVLLARVCFAACFCVSAPRRLALLWCNVMTAFFVKADISLALKSVTQFEDLGMINHHMKDDTRKTTIPLPPCCSSPFLNIDSCHFTTSKLRSLSRMHNNAFTKSFFAKQNERREHELLYLMSQ